jgi:hypothetical protein
MHVGTTSAWQPPNEPEFMIRIMARWSLGASEATLSLFADKVLFEGQPGDYHKGSVNSRGFFV